MSQQNEEIYDSEDIDVMNSEISGVVLLEVLTAIFLLPNLMIGIGFFQNVWYLDPISNFLSILVVFLSGLMFVTSFCIAWALWTVQPWARRYGIYASIISICVGPFPINMLMNAVIIVLLRGSTMKSIFP
ncbi:MAG: hypothetical protein ACFFF9_16000 [Candidatus Thorarchaeota archaeon]